MRREQRFLPQCALSFQLTIYFGHTSKKYVLLHFNEQINPRVTTYIPVSASVLHLDNTFPERPPLSSEMLDSESSLWAHQSEKRNIMKTYIMKIQEEHSLLCSWDGFFFIHTGKLQLNQLQPRNRVNSKKKRKSTRIFPTFSNVSFSLPRLSVALRNPVNIGWISLKYEYPFDI